LNGKDTSSFDADLISGLKSDLISAE